MSKLLLLDGHSLAYRAFYALPTDLATKNGTVTNAVYGFTSMLTKVIADEQPDYIAVAFDAPGGSTYRKEMDTEYKANRKETPDLFRSQLPLIHEVLKTLEIRQLEIEGVEADDVIATLTVQAADKGIDVVIVTGDRDSYQLVRDPHIKVLYNKRGVSDYVLYDEAGIAARCLGVTPAQYLDYASLRGDTSDNLPGVPGIGEKTAAKLITTYGGLEGIYEHLDELPPKQRTNLGEAKDRVFTNREMSRLVLDVDLDGISPTDLAQGAFDREKVRILFDQLEFRTLLPRMLDAVGDVAEMPEAEAFEVEVVVAHDAKAAAEVLRAAGNGDRVALEPRWAGPSGRSALIGLAVSTGAEATFIEGELLNDTSVRDAVTALTGPDSPPLVVHRAKELSHGLHQELHSLSYDTTLMAYLLDPGEGKYQLEDLALRYLSVELTSPDQVEGTLDFEGESGTQETGRRVAVLTRLADTMVEALGARELISLYEDIERPLVPVLAAMEGRGRAHRRCVPQRARQGARRRVPPPRSRDPRDGRRDVQRELHAAVAGRAVREARPHTGQEDEDRSVDRRRLVAEDVRGPSDRRDAAALPRGREAARHVRRRTPTARRCRRPHPRVVQPDRDHDRPHLVGLAEPAEHSGPHVERARAAQGVHRRRRLRSPHRRLLADRTAGDGTPGRRPRPRGRILHVGAADLDDVVPLVRLDGDRVRERLTAGIRRCFTATAAAMFIAEGKVSFEDCDILT